MDELLNIVASALGYQWLDDESKKVLDYQIEEGSRFLKNLDPSIDFGSDAWSRGLLISYVMYTRANAGDEFRKNYRQDLLILSDRGRVAGGESDDAGA